MAVTTTPLGFQKPDGNDPISNGDNVISANAQKAEDLIAADRGRLGTIEALGTAHGTRITATESKNGVQDDTLATHAARLANLDNAAGFTGDPLALNDAAVAEAVKNGTASHAELDARLEIQNPPIVADIIANDPTVANSAATMAQNTAGLVPVWKATTSYTTGQRVISPDGDVVAAKTNFTTTSTYAAANWTASTQGANVKANGDAVTDLTARAKPLSAATSPGWALPFADKAGYTTAGIRTDGTFEAYRFKNSTRSSMARVACAGDSLTAGYSNAAAWAAEDSYPYKLGLELGGSVTVFNRGYSGATTDQINMYLGALPLTFTVTNGYIAGTNDTPLTKTQSIGGWTDADTVNIYGYLNDVYGLLNNTPGTGWKFTRAVAGTAKAATVAEFEGQWREHAWDTLVYAAGRNDINKTTLGMEKSVSDHAVRGYVDTANYLLPRRKQLAFMGTILQTTETPGSNGWNLVHDINSRVKALYPANYIDLLGYLTTTALADAGLTPTTADTDAMALGMIPPQLMDDATHYSRAAANVIARNLVAPFLRKKGWV